MGIPTNPFRKFLLPEMVLFALAGPAVCQSAQVNVFNAPVVPQTIRYDGAAVEHARETVEIVFRIYSSMEGGEPLWSETQSVSIGVDGKYSVFLGTDTLGGLPQVVFVAGQARWLGISVAQGAEQTRIPLVSVAYAMKAADAETLGGLPAAAFVTKGQLGTVSAAAATASGNSGSAQPDTSPSGTGIAGAIALWTNSTTLGSSAITQAGTASTPFIGIRTTSPTSTLDINGTTTQRGNFTLSTLGVATTTTGIASPKLSLTASSFLKGGAAESQNFVWQALPTANNTATPGASLRLFFASGSNALAATGLTISPKGVFTFAAGQTFPGTGTITRITASSPLTGGGTTGAVTVGLSTSALVATLNSVYPRLSAANTFTGNQTVTGNVRVSGTVSGGGGNVGSGVAGATSSTASQASGVLGSSTATTGAVFGVLGTARSTTTGAAGVNGVESAATGQVYGVSGSTRSTTASAAGVWGNASATTGATYGVWGGTNSSSGVGVFGVNNSTAGGTGVNGIMNATSGRGSGVSGTTNSPNGIGVLGENNAIPGAGIGILGKSAGTYTGATGVKGSATDTTGSNYGVVGSSNSVQGYGVFGSSPYTAVSGWSQSCTETSCTVTSGTAGDFVTGVEGIILSGSQRTASTISQTFSVHSDGSVYSSGDGFFAGNLTVLGKVSKGSGSFKIDHPLDPANKYLSHSFVESPDMMNVYNGNVTTDRRGLATVVLPDYFETLNRDFRYQLTVIGQFAQAIVAKEIDNNRFVIRTNKPGVKVSWQVTGIRQDAYANANRIPVEEDKPVEERGLYLHPDVFGQPQSKSVSAAVRPASNRDQVLSGAQ